MKNKDILNGDVMIGVLCEDMLNSKGSTHIEVDGTVCTLVNPIVKFKIQVVVNNKFVIDIQII